MNKQDLLEMLTYKRPAWSPTEREFIGRYLDSVPGMEVDGFGNRIHYQTKSRVMISCHTDTVHREGGRQLVRTRDRIVKLPHNSKSNCLGADCTAGVYAALRMIEAGVKACFVFHRAEEVGGLGSQWLADEHPDWVEQFDICLALDRRGTKDIIVDQCGGCASHEFAWSLGEALGMGHRPAQGIFTDSANYVELIPECSNISVGYENEHRPNESLDVVYLEKLIEGLVGVDWDSIAVVRDPRPKWAGDWTGWLDEDRFEERFGDRFALDPETGELDFNGTEEEWERWQEEMGLS